MRPSVDFSYLSVTPALPLPLSCFPLQVLSSHFESTRCTELLIIQCEMLPAVSKDGTRGGCRGFITKGGPTFTTDVCIGSSRPRGQFIMCD